jgi:tRNA 2-thiouridine synthesizing protein A
VDTTLQPTTTTDASSAPAVDITVDARGQSCPGPIVSLAKELKAAASGTVVELLATDPGSKTDIPSWAKLTGNELLEAREGDGVFTYRIRVR